MADSATQPISTPALVCLKTEMGPESVTNTMSNIYSAKLLLAASTCQAPIVLPACRLQFHMRKKQQRDKDDTKIDKDSYSLTWGPHETMQLQAMLQAIEAKRGLSVPFEQYTYVDPTNNPRIYAQTPYGSIPTFFDQNLQSCMHPNNEDIVVVVPVVFVSFVRSKRENRVRFQLYQAYLLPDNTVNFETAPVLTDEYLRAVMTGGFDLSGFVDR